ncbi:MAG: tetratricopeptide repeat protein [Bacteroidetes bacterium]|nr:tetratricopeptide repeat protein [Bacteroidota bacterium]
MKNALNILIFSLLPFAASAIGELDTIKISTDASLAADPAVDELRLALYDLRNSEKEKQPENQLAANEHIGEIYYRVAYFSRSVKYFKQAELLAKLLRNESKLLAVQWQIANAYFEDEKYRNTIEVLVNLQDVYETEGNYQEQVKVLEKLAQANNAISNFTKSIDYYLKIKRLAERKNDPTTQATALNNLGFTANKQQDFKAAVDYFAQAETIYKANPGIKNNFVYSNLGIAYNNLGETRLSLENLQMADNGLADKSYVQHLIASIYLKNKDIYNALKYNELAITSSQKAKNAQVECDAFEAASQIYTQLFEYDKALDFYKKHLSLKDSLLRDERLRQQNLEALHNLLERTENETIQGISDEEVRQLEMARLDADNRRLQLETDNQRLDADRKEKEIALLKQEDEIKEANLRSANLESERNRQALKLATQQLLAEKQGREIANLAQQNKLDSLEAANQKAEQQQQIAMLESQKQLDNMKIQQQESFRKTASWIGLLGGALMLLIAGSWLYGRRLNKRLASQNQQIEAQKTEIDVERARAEGLLLNILPDEVAAELKEQGSATPRHYNSASVLFTDFVGFTKISAMLPPGEVVQELNKFFLGFDEIVERHNLEKIKTIGDSYMAAGGLPVENRTHPKDAVAAGREILQFIKQQNALNAAASRPQWQIRIGIHSGELVAGVVGSKKFAYDIWGDTVNTASRMESNGPIGEINISEATYKLVRNDFECEYRGELEVKNKGKLGMYIVK